MLDANVLGSLIDAALQGDGARGPRRTRFSYAVARGVVKHFIGKKFQTLDVGNGVGGTGIGMGIKNLDSSNMAQIAYDTMDRHGPKARSFWNAIMGAIKQHLDEATLLSTVDPSVGIGSGTVIVGSFTVNIPELQRSIQTEIELDGARGPRRQNFSLCCATGVVQDVLAHGTGTTTISGGSSLPPSTTGTGDGTMS